MNDIAKLHGVWDIVAIEVEGQEFPSGGVQIVFTGVRFVSLNMGAEYEGTITVDETCAPKTFDLLYDKGPHSGKTSLGIYELSAHEWKICLGFAGVGRPERFATAKGTGHALQTLRRSSLPTA